MDVTERHSLRLGLLATVLLAVASTFSYAQTQAVTLAWDPNPEPSVDGYVIYVGNTSGSYDERYEVRDQTTFVYRNLNPGRPYYFAVAAYEADGTVGQPSEEIFFLAGSASAGATATVTPSIFAREVSPEPSGDRSVVCSYAVPAVCYNSEDLGSVAGDARAPTPTGDGRLLFIEDGRRVRVILGNAIAPDPALTADADRRLFGLALDPAFDRNRFVYVSEVETGVDGRRLLSIVRYREVANVLAEGAGIVTGIPLPPDGGAPFTIDGARRLYVAVPSTGDRSEYGGMVLRFEADGSVPRDGRGGSPVFAYGQDRPVSLIWSDMRNELWLAGFNGSGDGALARLPIEGSTTNWPRVLTATSVIESNSSIVSLSTGHRLIPGSSATADQEPGELVAVDEDGGMLRIDARNPQAPARGSLPTWVDELPTSTAPDGTYLYVVLTSSGGDTSRIVRLRRSSN